MKPKSILKSGPGHCNHQERQRKPKMKEQKMMMKSVWLKAAAAFAAAVIMILTVTSSPVNAAELQRPVQEERIHSYAAMNVTQAVTSSANDMMPRLADMNPKKILPAKLEGSVANRFVQLTSAVTKSTGFAAKVQEIADNTFAQILA